MGNGINWKGQIFPKMRNYTPSHRMTGIGNALKTKYQQLLGDYERVSCFDDSGCQIVLVSSFLQFSTAEKAANGVSNVFKLHNELKNLSSSVLCAQLSAS